MINMQSPAAHARSNRSRDYGVLLQGGIMGLDGLSLRSVPGGSRQPVSLFEGYELVSSDRYAIGPDT